MKDAFVQVATKPKEGIAKRWLRCRLFTREKGGGALVSAEFYAYLELSEMLAASNKTSIFIRISCKEPGMPTRTGTAADNLIDLRVETAVPPAAGLRPKLGGR